MFAARRQSRSTRLFCRVSPNTGEVGQPLILSPCLFDLRGWKHRQRDTESRAGVIQGLRGFFCIYCIEKAGTTKGESRKTLSFCFNTASGMDRMQYRPSQPLGQLNPEAGFLNGTPFLANRRNPAGFFCLQNRLKTSANPVISRKLLSTGKI